MSEIETETEHPAREIRDCYGRRYYLRDRASDRDGRAEAPWLAWPPMVAVGLLQYGFGAMVPSVAGYRHWPLPEVFVLLAGWVIFQAGVGFPVAYLRERRRLAPRPAMLIAAVLCAVAPVSLVYGPGPVGALLGYSVLGGAGAGLVYATCCGSITRWYPERVNGRVSVVTGAFAYGAAPFAAAAASQAGVDPVRVLGAVAILTFLVVAGFGAFFRDPPARWWPAWIDPKTWALHQVPGRRANVPAARQFSPAQAIRTGALVGLCLVAVGAGAVSLFDAAFLVVFMSATAWGSGVMALSIGLLIGLNGAGRSAAIRLSDRLGRCRVLRLVLLVQAAGQVLLAVAASTGSTSVLVLAAVLAGCGGGAFYPLVASLVRNYFGDGSALEVHAVVYSAKALAGVLGVGLAALAVTAWGFGPVFLVAAGVSLSATVVIAGLHRPGLPRTLPGIGRLV